MARFTLLVLLALLAAPAAASASYVELRRAPGWTFTYTADPGERNALVVTKGDAYRVRDAGAAIRAGENCSHEGAEVVCRLPAGTVLRAAPTGPVDLGDEDDSATIPNDFVLLGGPGDDQLTGGAQIEGGPGGDTMTATGYGTLSYAERTAPVAVTFDDMPNDGEPGEGDDVRGAFSRIAGGPGDDLLSAPSWRGPRLGTLVLGNGGDDRLLGGAGPDELEGGDGDDGLEGGEGDDRLWGHAGADSIRGGPGSDSFYASGGTAGVTIVPDDQPNDGASGEGDDVGGDVENFTTGTGDDYVVGTAAGNRIETGEGDDTVLAGAGPDEIHPGFAGADTVDGGPGGDSIHDVIEAADTIRMRDGETDAFTCFPDARPRLEADPFEATRGCISFLGVSSRLHELRPSRSGAVSLRAVCVELLPRACRGEMRLIARSGGTVLARGLYDVAPGAKRTIRLRLTSRGRATLRRTRGRVPFTVLIRPADALSLAPGFTIGRGALVR
jgi:hypothetical protein